MTAVRTAALATRPRVQCALIVAENKRSGERDQRRHHPRIPSDLANAWRATAAGVLASLASDADRP